jgi:hypothetical protein
MIKDFLNSNHGQIIISIILGLGLAAIFRKVCTGNSCIVIQGPSKQEIDKYYYKLNDDCYKYTPFTVPCDVKQS